MEIESIVLLETSIDHLTGEELGGALEALNNMEEVLDALFLTGIGKKNRPAGLLQVLCRPLNEHTVSSAVFRHTHALGLRRQIVERYVLPRHADVMKVENIKVAAKSHELDGLTYIRPEAGDLKHVAEKLGMGMPGLRFHKS